MQETLKLRAYLASQGFDVRDIPKDDLYWSIMDLTAALEEIADEQVLLEDILNGTRTTYLKEDFHVLPGTQANYDDIMAVSKGLYLGLGYAESNDPITLYGVTNIVFEKLPYRTVSLSIALLQKRILVSEVLKYSPLDGGVNNN